MYKVEKVYIYEDYSADYGYFTKWQDVADIVKGFKADKSINNLIVYSRKRCKYFYLVTIV
jgi:hypothetical protein